MILGVVYLLQGNASAAPMDADHLIPKWTGIASLVLIVNNFLSYSGMEMNAVHVGSLKNPGKEFPRAMFFACGLVLLIFILPALAISWVIPAEELSLTAGRDAGVRRLLRLLQPAEARPDRRDRAGLRVGGRHAHLARRARRRACC